MRNGDQKDMGCNGKGTRTILIKIKKFKTPAKMFIECKCQVCLAFKKQKKEGKP